MSSHNRNEGTSRRNFLKSAAGMAAASIVTSAKGQHFDREYGTDPLPPDAIISVGVIGCGRRGRELLSCLLELPNVSVPIVCDVSSIHAAQASQIALEATGTRPATTSDYLDVVQWPDTHAVVIATPDHWHLNPFLEACAAQKDIYLEVPVSLAASEGPVMVQAARKYRRVVQTGLQLRSSDWFRTLPRYLMDRKLGRVASTRAWTFADMAPIPKVPDTGPPEYLDYDRWLGPAPLRPYNVNRVSQNWFRWWDYGGGEACRWNVHLSDLLHVIMRSNVPNTVAAMGGRWSLDDFRETPDTLQSLSTYRTIDGEFVHQYTLACNRSSLPSGKGGNPGFIEEQMEGRAGLQIDGSRATLVVDQNGPILEPSHATRAPASRPSDDIDSDPPNAGAQRSSMRELTRAHVANFVDCIRSRAEPNAPIEAGRLASFACQLANIAHRAERRLFLDPRQFKLFRTSEHKREDEEASSFLHPFYRNEYMPPRV